MKNTNDKLLWSLQYLKDTLGVSDDEIKEAVENVGTNEDYIKMYLLNKQNNDGGEILPSITKDASNTAGSDENISDVFDNTLGSDTD